MKTIQLNIGRNSNRTGKPIARKDWETFKRKIESLAAIYLAAETVAKGTYHDGVWNEQAFFLTAHIPSDVPREAVETFRKSLSFWAKVFEQDSIAFSTFAENELVFAQQ